METLFLNIVKSSGLIAMFYIAYYLLLRKETFFTANRWFLLGGLLTSVILPWIVFTTIVWVEPTPTNIDWSKIPMTPAQEENFEINWYFVLTVAYAIGTVLLLAQFAYDFYHLNRVIKGKTIQRQADHKFIDLKENIAPFSYFNTIVYNSSLYSESEMESILEHEKVHSEQFHTVDVLIIRFFCILFWFNPFIWLYKKAILQNLEFIADSEATKNLSDKKAYQMTLLKITTHENCVVLTNHFYQSLIKKRIVMLNKNQSKKWNSLKYALVIPVLIAFVFVFQMEVIAKEKPQSIEIEQSISKVENSNKVEINKITKKANSNNEIKTSTNKNVDVYKINKNTTDTELKEKAEAIFKNYGINVVFPNTKRNTNNEITEITVEFKKDSQTTKTKTIKGTDAIKPCGIGFFTDINGVLVFNFTEEPNMNEYDIYIDDKKATQEELNTLDPKTIESMNVNNEKEKSIHVVIKKRNNSTQDENAPVPPTPPTPPVLKFKAPVPPAMPKAPKAPKGDPIHGDKKAWKEFEKQMEEFDAKMKKMEPQMEAFDKQMADFDKQMEPFEKEMKVFEEKMKVYEKEMEKYISEKRKNKS